MYEDKMEHLCQISRVLKLRLKIFQEGSHFSAPQVPHMGHLGHVLVMCPILGHLYLSDNENAVLKIVQDGLHFGSSQAAHLSCLSCSIEKPIFLLNNNGHNNAKELYFKI